MFFAVQDNPSGVATYGVADPIIALLAITGSASSLNWATPGASGFIVTEPSGFTECPAAVMTAGLSAIAAVCKPF
jgi:hypothetical protein